jgi:hypothetical protein
MDSLLIKNSLCLCAPLCIVFRWFVVILCQDYNWFFYQLALTKKSFPVTGFKNKNKIK